MSGLLDRRPVSATPAFREFVATWLAEHQIEWRRSHIKVLNSTLDGHLLPAFGDKPVGTITKSDVLNFRAKLAEKPGRIGTKLSAKRINNILAVMRQVMADAADTHRFTSPFSNVKPLKVRKVDIQPFTLEEVDRILKTVRMDWRDYLQVRFLTGMRTGEVNGLKWKYVDFERRLILVRETFVLGEDEYTKTDSSQRDIQMSQPVYEALKRQWEVSGKLSEYVFCNREGHPIDNKNFSDRVWYPLLRHLGLAQRRPYQMRHTAATLWLASGENPQWISNQLGQPLPAGHAALGRLLHDLPRALLPRQREFLLSVAQAAPNWALMSYPHLEQLPALQWKLVNLEKLRRNGKRFAQQHDELAQRLAIL